MALQFKRILISRTDSIGDVMLTLPITAWIKTHFPTAKVTFLGRNYTKAVVGQYPSVDAFESLDNLETLLESEAIEFFKGFDTVIHVFPNKTVAKWAKKAGVKHRIGTSHRLYHLWTCNHRLNFTRKASDLHESQLNFELLKPFGLTEIPSLEMIERDFVKLNVPNQTLPEPFTTFDNHIILHPKSQGSAKEWPLSNYFELATKLADLNYKVVFTGTAKEGEMFKADIPKHANIFDSTGAFTLPELMAFIARAKALVACSTGPLHIAGFYGVHTVGFFSPRKPIHPGRWRALGQNVDILVNDESCQTCAKGEDCSCIESITVNRVLDKLAQDGAIN